MCGVYAIDMKTGNILGSLTWPYGNQIFAIDYILSTITQGFLATSVRECTDEEYETFFRYQV